MAVVLTHTCLPASPALQAAGFSVVVALEHDRIPLAAFKLGKDASAWCNERNGIVPAKPPAKPVEPPAPAKSVEPPAPAKPVGVTQTLTPGHSAGTPKPH